MSVATMDAATIAKQLDMYKEIRVYLESLLEFVKLPYVQPDTPCWSNYASLVRSSVAPTPIGFWVNAEATQLHSIMCVQGRDVRYASGAIETAILVQRTIHEIREELFVARKQALRLKETKAAKELSSLAQEFWTVFKVAMERTTGKKEDQYDVDGYFRERLGGLD